MLDTADVKACGGKMSDVRCLRPLVSCHRTGDLSDGLMSFKTPNKIVHVTFYDGVHNIVVHCDSNRARVWHCSTAPTPFYFGMIMSSVRHVCSCNITCSHATVYLRPLLTLTS